MLRLIFPTCFASSVYSLDQFHLWIYIVILFWMWKTCHTNYYREAYFSVSMPARCPMQIGTVFTVQKWLINVRCRKKKRWKILRFFCYFHRNSIRWIYSGSVVPKCALMPYNVVTNDAYSIKWREKKYSFYGINQSNGCCHESIIQKSTFLLLQFAFWIEKKPIAFNIQWHSNC